MAVYHGQFGICARLPVLTWVLIEVHLIANPKRMMIYSHPETLVNWAFFDGHYWVYGGFRLFDGLRITYSRHDGRNYFTPCGYCQLFN